MYITILNYDPTNEVLTYELPSYTAGFNSEQWEEYIWVTLGVSPNGVDWQIHEELPVIITLTEQRQNA